MTSLFLDALYLWAGVLLMPRWLYLAPKSKRYRVGLGQRFGFVPRLEDGPRRLWVHCASVGEAAIPRRLIERLGEKQPDLEFVFSSCTDTGVERLRELYPGSEVFFYPFDLSASVRSALCRIKPVGLILVEQELWPNMLLACRSRKIPIAVVNGRMNAGSSRLNRTLFRLFPAAADAIRICCVRSNVDGQRFEYAGVEGERVVNTGSLKYEVLEKSVPEEQINVLRQRLSLGEEDKVLVCGSTHEGEEEVLAGVWRRLRGEFPSLRLIIAPRHVERAGAVAALLRRRGYSVERLTELEEVDRGPGREAVILIDTIGRLVECYAVADVVFVGRSLFQPGGGQNMMEPAALGKPVITGTYTGNFRPEMEVLESADAVRRVADAAELEGEIERLLRSRGESEKMGKRAREVVLGRGGAAERTAEEIRNGFGF